MSWPLSSFSDYQPLIFRILKILLYTTQKKVYAVNVMSEINPKFGELIKKKRIERRLTQEEVAELIGCHPQYYKNLENGKGMPSLPMFCRIMWAFHISADEYVWPEQYLDNPTYKSLLNLLNRCDEYMLSVLLATAEALLTNASHKTDDKTEK